MTGNKYSAVRRSIAELLASKDGRAALALNNYKSGTPIVPALEDEPLGHFYNRVDQAAGSGHTAVAAVLVNGQLQMASVSPIEGRKQDLPNSERSPESVTADPKNTVGMLFAMLANHNQLGVKTRPFDYGKYAKVAVSFDMPERGGSLQSA